MKRLLDRNIAGEVELTALSADGVAFDFTEADDRTVFVATGAGTITVLAGNGPQGVADFEITLTGDVSVFTLDSFLFKNASGDNKGKVVIKGADTIEVGVIALP